MKRRPPEDHFKTAHLEAGMRRRSVRAAAITMLSQGARFALSVTSTMVLARLLRPHDFGLFAMAITMFALLIVLRDLGLATATVQRKDLTQEIVSTLFWINSLFGILLALSAVATAPLVAWFFQDERLTAVVAALGGLTALEGFAVQHRALLRRQMRFTAIAYAQLVAEGVGIAAGVIAAKYGAGYWSLVILRVTSSVVRVILVWMMCPWRPSFVFNYSSVRPMVAFGGFLVSTRLVRYISRNFDRFLIGRIWEAGALGYYIKASGWLPGPITRFMMPIAGVAISTLSRLVDQPERFRAYFRQGILIIALLGIPAVGFIVFDGNQLVLFLLGDQWFPTVPIFRRLAPAAIAALVQMGFHWTFLSLGNADRQLRWEIVSTTIIVAGISMGVRWGIEGAALGYSIASVLLLPPGAWYCFRGTFLRTSDIAGAFLLPIAATLIGMGCLSVVHSFDFFPAANTLQLLLDAVVFGTIYLAALLSLPGGRKAVTGVVVLLKDLRRSRP